MATATLNDFGATIPGAKKHLAEKRAANNSDKPENVADAKRLSVIAMVSITSEARSLAKSL